MMISHYLHGIIVFYDDMIVGAGFKPALIMRITDEMTEW